MWDTDSRRTGRKERDPEQAGEKERQLGERTKDRRRMPCGERPRVRRVRRGEPREAKERSDRADTP